MDPSDIRFSQNTAGGRGRAAQLRESMKDGWNGPAVDAVRTPDGIVTIDNTRIAVARELGLKCYRPNYGRSFCRILAV